MSQCCRKSSQIPPITRKKFRTLKSMFQGEEDLNLPSCLCVVTGMWASDGNCVPFDEENR